MRVRVRALAAGKHGNEPEEYEDAYWPRRAFARSAIRCAVADGATEASFSGVWARLLVESYRRGALRTDLAALPLLQRRWREHVASKSLPWYAEEKARLGAFSSLLGITVENGYWQAMAVGDSCLFHVRDGAVLTAFPIEHSDDLSAAPHLISSLPANNKLLTGHLRIAQGTAETGDTLYVMTDALAGWFLRRVEDGHPLHELAELHPRTFPAWLDTQRANRSIRNDDTTVIRINIL